MTKDKPPYAARITDDGNRIRLPKPVLEALGVQQGDLVLFQIDGPRVFIVAADIVARHRSGVR